MKEEIEILREELNNLIKNSTCLYTEKIIELSQKLDELLNTYYESKYAKIQ